VPDIIHNYLSLFVKNLINNAIITGSDPVQMFGTGKLIRAMRNRLRCQAFDMLNNVRNKLSGDFPEILFSALFQRDRIRIHVPRSQYAFLHLGKTDGVFIPPLGDHGEIVKIFPEVFVFFDGKDHGDPVTVLVNNILLRDWHTGS